MYCRIIGKRRNKRKNGGKKSCRTKHNPFLCMYMFSIYTLPYLPVLTEVQLCEGGEVSKGLLGDLTTMQIASGT